MWSAIEELLPEEFRWPAGQAAEALSAVPARPGVWMLLAEGDAPLLAATSQNMRAVIAGRLTAPDPLQRSRKTDLSQTAVACRYAVTHGRLESDWLYARLVHAIWPEEFWDRVSFAPMWMLKASSVAGAMKLQPTTAWPEPGDLALGPMASRSDAQDLADALTDLFDLCRYWQILARAPHGTPCAYFEMGRCLAPCAGRIPMAQYNQMVRDAMAFAGPDRASVLVAKEAEMKAAAAALEFEKASKVKDWLKRTAPLAEPRYAHLGRIEDFAGVAVSRFRLQASPFFFWAGVLETGEPVKLSQVEEHLPAWWARLQAGPTAAVDGPRVRQWQCGLLATHIFRPQQGLAWMPRTLGMDAWPAVVRRLTMVREPEPT